MADMRISVSNFDAPEQSRLWLALGAEQATRKLLGGLRTALLIAETVVVDRNQLLDGIFFLAMGPDRLAWHLGLEPGARLPLAIDCQPPPDLDAPTAGWARTLAEFQYEQVAGPAEARGARVSSALIALTGSYDRGDTGPGSVLEELPSPAWRERSDPAFLSQELWDHASDERSELRDLIDARRREWVEAIAAGRVAAKPWSGRTPDVHAALERAAEHVADDEPLADALLALRERQPDGSWAPPSRRAPVVRWLDGERIDGTGGLPVFDPPHLPDALAALPRSDRAWALRWWNSAYYEAIREKDDLRMLTLRGVGVSDLDGDRARHWGLAADEVSRIRLAWRRLRGRRRPRSGNLAVDGEILEHMEVASPSAFASVAQARDSHGNRLLDEPSNRHVFDLALRVRSAVGETPPRRQQVLIRWLRVAAFTLIALTLALRDAEVLVGSGAWFAVLWALLALIGAFPWSEVGSLFSMRSTRMQSTLRLRSGS
ncbi:hypothetical protein [Microbacterium halophytorum]|uniref:hypothetical protein n=1 Tax=Microbacterium halophytorum TaxID=2067568 RepID=UPI00131A4809|nr:hypothetical protein [Microbacterium halophytorum]